MINFENHKMMGQESVEKEGVILLVLQIGMLVLLPQKAKKTMISQKRRLEQHILPEERLTIIDS